MNTEKTTPTEPNRPGPPIHLRSLIIWSVCILLAEPARQTGSADLPPRLAASISGGNIQLFWPAGPKDWMLCARTDLAEGNWTGTYLAVTDYGANGSDTVDDPAAIENCITAATIQGKTVWFAAGTYYQKRSFTLDSIVARGAGMWHTAIIGTETGGPGRIAASRVAAGLWSRTTL